MKLALACVCAVSLAVQASHEPSRQVRLELPASGISVAMLDDGGRPMVAAMINGKGPYRFILDTGANYPALDPSVATELGLPDSAGVEGGSGSRIADLQIGEATAHGLVAGHLAGMLGRGGSTGPVGVLSAEGFQGILVVLDYPGKQVRFIPGTLPSANGQDIFEYGDDQELPVIPVTVAGREIHIHLDSGSPAGLMLPLHYQAELPLSGQPRQVGTARTVAGSFPVWSAQVDGSASIGRFPLDLKEIRLSDLRPGPKPGIGNIGGEVLRDFVVTIDGSHRRVRLARP